MPLGNPCYCEEDSYPSRKERELHILLLAAMDRRRDNCHASRGNLIELPLCVSPVELRLTLLGTPDRRLHLGRGLAGATAVTRVSASSPPWAPELSSRSLPTVSSMSGTANSRVITESFCIRATFSMRALARRLR